ncbi:hypothetical protein Tco_1403121 [Tanacetum coccineum]
MESESERVIPELAAGSSKRDAEEELVQESLKRQKTRESLEPVEEPKNKEEEELSQERIQQMMIIVPEQGMNVEALQTKEDKVKLWSDQILNGYIDTKEYLPKVHHTRQMDDDLRESYRTLEKCLFHKGRIVTPSFIVENNMLPFFQAIGLESFLNLNEPICPRFVVEFYHSLEVKRNEEDTPYIEFKLETFYSSEWSLNSLDDPPNSKFFGPKHDLVKKATTVPRITRAQLLRDPNTLYVDDICPDLKGWELFFKENFFCSIDKRNKVKSCTAYMLYYLTIGRKFNVTSMIIYRMKEVIKKHKGPIPFSMLLTRLFNHILETNPQAIDRPARYTFHECVMDPLYISRKPRKEKGKNVISSPVISSSSSSSDENEGPSFLKFYDELSDNEDLTKA